MRKLLWLLPVFVAAWPATAASRGAAWPATHRRASRSPKFVSAFRSVADHLGGGAPLSRGWAAARAHGRTGRVAVDLGQRAGNLSGGQRAQLALTVAIAKRPELLILDEPVASLDPLARREFLQDLIEAVAEQSLSVVLSSHLISDLEQVGDYLIVLVASRVRVAGATSEPLAT